MAVTLVSARGLASAVDEGGGLENMDPEDMVELEVVVEVRTVGQNHIAELSIPMDNLERNITPRTIQSLVAAVAHQEGQGQPQPFLCCNLV